MTSDWGLVAGVWALVGVLALALSVHFVTRPRSATISPLLDVLVAVVFLVVAMMAGTVAVTV